MEFKAKIIELDGKRQIVITANTEIIKYPDGRQDVIIHAPSLDMISKQLNIGGK